MKQLILTAFSRDANTIDVVGYKADGSYDMHEIVAGDYVPKNIGLGPGGDYINITIDIESGMIVGWEGGKVKAALQQIIDEREDDV